MNLRDLTPDARAEVFREIFEVDQRGAAILEYLMALFHARPAVTKGGIDAILQTYQIIGQQSVVQHIINQVNKTRGVPDPEGEEL